MRDKVSGKLTISRVFSNAVSKCTELRLSIETEDYEPVIEISINAEQLMLALTGQALVECKILNKQQIKRNGG